MHAAVFGAEKVVALKRFPQHVLRNGRVRIEQHRRAGGQSSGELQHTTSDHCTQFISVAAVNLAVANYRRFTVVSLQRTGHCTYAVPRFGLSINVAQRAIGRFVRGNERGDKRGESQIGRSSNVALEQFDNWLRNQLPGAHN